MVKPKTYTIPCRWEQWGEVEIKADSLDEAEQILMDKAPRIPDEGCLYKASFQIFEESEEELCEECEKEETK